MKDSWSKIMNNYNFNNEDLNMIIEKVESKREKLKERKYI